MSEEKTEINLTQEELETLKIICDFLFFDQLKHMASFPRFESCFGATLTNENRTDSLVNIFKDLCGPKKKYITFPRLIKAYLTYKENPDKFKEETKQFFKAITSGIIKKDSEPVGNQKEGSIKYTTNKNGKKMYAISKFCVITDEQKEKIKGFRIYYDDFFKNDLFLNKANDPIYISLEINLSIREDAKLDKFPDINSRDGITHIIGTYDNDTINFLGFKTRSGKTQFIGSPKGIPFIIGDFKKQIQAIDIEVKNGLLTYLIPHFEEVERVNPHLNKKLSEINQEYINNDKLLYEEAILDRLSEEEANEKMFIPLINDDHFFNPKLNDIISGNSYSDFMPLAHRFFPKKRKKGNRKKREFKEEDILKNAMEFYNNKRRGKRKNGHHRKRKGFGNYTQPTMSKVPNKLDILLQKNTNEDNNNNNNNENEEIKTLDFLLSKDNYFELMENIADKIGKEFKSKNPQEVIDNQPEDMYFDEEEAGDDIPVDERGFRWNNNNNEGNNDYVDSSEEENEGKYNPYNRGGNTALNIEDKKELESYFNEIKNDSKERQNNNNNNQGQTSTTFADYENNTGNNENIRKKYSTYEEYMKSYLSNYIESTNNINITEKEKAKEEKEKISKKKIAELTQKAQTNWQNLAKKYSKISGIFILKTIGAVVRALSFLKAYQSGETEKYSIEEQVHMFEVLNSNSDIVSMLSKAHEESLRREAERKKLEEDREKLEQMKLEEEKRQAEEKKRLEEENARRQEEKRIANEQYELEQKKKQREEEERQRQLEIQKEEDERKKKELEKLEEEKRRKEQEAELEKQKQLEEEKRRIEEEKQRQLEEQKRKEEEAQQNEKNKETENKTTKNYTEDDLNALDEEIEMIKYYLNKATGSEKSALLSYYESLVQERNEILEHLTENQKIEIAKELDFNTEEELKKEEAERKKLQEEENKKIEEERLKEEEKAKEATKYVSINDLFSDAKIYKNQKLSEKNKIWNDDIFQPLKKNLCPVDSYGRWNFPEGIDSNDVEGWENIVWARAEEIFNSKNYQVFYEGIKADDIIQGGLGDCYFLSAVAALCKYPKLVEKLFYFKEKSLEHCYGCYYKVSGVWQLVLVDDYIPCYGKYGKNPAFTSSNGNELWVMLLEKAWAKLNGNYAKAIGGEPHEVFDVITNAWSEKIKLESSKSDTIWKSMLNAEKNGFIMTAGTSTDTYNLNIEELGLIPGHAYTCLEVKEVTTKSGKVKLVHLRNPWGNGEWSGEWCDSSKKWTDDLRKQVGKSKSAENQGSFWMAFEHFLTYYTILGICHLFEDYLYTILHVQKEKVKNGPILSKLEIKNDNTHVFIMLHQKNPRIILDDGTYQKPVIIYLMLLDNNFNFLKSNSTGSMNCCVEETLKKGTYYILSDANFRFIQNGTIHGVNISAYSSSEVSLSLEESKNVNDTFKKGIYSYSKKNISPQSFANGNLYQSKSSDEFPFNFILFDNEGGNYDVTLTDNLVFRGNKCASFYLEDQNQNSLAKTVTPNTWDLFVHMPWSYGSAFSYELKTSAKQSSSSNKTSTNKTSTNQNTSSKSNSQDDIVNAVFAEQAQVLDNQGYIKQYLHQAGNGYYIGLENGSKKNLNMKLMMEGLYEVNNPNASTVTFTINSMTRRVFSVKVKSNYKGNITYMFDYA
jgi:hypothetical protein